jgi:hypothetical protein
MNGPIPIAEYAELRSEVHRIDRDLARTMEDSKAVNVRLYGVERELHLAVTSIRWGFGLLGALIIALVGAVLKR